MIGFRIVRSPLACVFPGTLFQHIEYRSGAVEDSVGPMILVRGTGTSHLVCRWHDPDFIRRVPRAQHQAYKMEREDRRGTSFTSHPALHRRSFSQCYEFQPDRHDAIEPWSVRVVGHPTRERAGNTTIAPHGYSPNSRRHLCVPSTATSVRPRSAGRPPN